MTRRIRNDEGTQFILELATPLTANISLVQPPYTYFDICVWPHIVIIEGIRWTLRASVFQRDFVLGHEQDEHELDNERIEKAAGAGVLPCSEIQGYVRDRSIMKPIGVDGVAEVQIAVAVKPIGVGIVAWVMMYAVGVEQYGCPRRNV